MSVERATTADPQRDVACVTGRFQPVHRQHMELFEVALRRHHHLVVGITNPRRRVGPAAGPGGHRHLKDANPFSYPERVALLRPALLEIAAQHRFTVVPFDIDQLDALPAAVPLTVTQYVRARGDWEDEKTRLLQEVGYSVVKVPPSGPDLSATAVRERLRAGGWEPDVPAAAAAVLRRLLRARTMAQWITA